MGALTRVEGEGALHVELRNGVAERVELNIYEPPRFFEAFLRGRAHTATSTGTNETRESSSDAHWAAGTAVSINVMVKKVGEQGEGEMVGAAE